jgi:hypothetical protein
VSRRQTRDVRTSDKRLLARTGDDNHTNRIIVSQLIKGGDAFLVNQLVESVQFVGRLMVMTATPLSRFSTVIVS